SREQIPSGRRALETDQDRTRKGGDRHVRSPADRRGSGGSGRTLFALHLGKIERDPQFAHCQRQLGRGVPGRGPTPRGPCPWGKSTALPKDRGRGNPKTIGQTGSHQKKQCTNGQNNNTTEGQHRL